MDATGVLHHITIRGIKRKLNLSPSAAMALRVHWHSIRGAVSLLSRSPDKAQMDESGLP